MKLVVQRVSRASVAVKETGKISGKIDKGLFVLLGIKKGDTQKDVDYLVDKLSKLRVMADEDEKMNLSVLDTQSSILVVSQFTLHANTRDGNRPSFVEAALPADAKSLYEYFIERLRENNITVETGEFGSYMQISAELDGPVTIILES